MKRQNKYHFFFGGFRNSLYLCNVVWLRLYDFAEYLKKRYFTNYNIKVMKKLLLMKTMLLLCALIVGSSSVWAGTITFSELGLENSVQYLDPFDGGDFTVTFAGGANDGKYYNTGTGIRVYGNGTMTIAAKSGNITKIVVTCSGSSYAPSSDNVVNVGTYDHSTGTWTGEAASVVFTRPSGNGHWRVQSVTATVSGGGELPQSCATPTFSVGTGTYTTAQNVTLACETENAAIHYTMTIDGTTPDDPTESDATYSAAIPVTKSGTIIKAKAFKSEMTASTVATATYTIKPNTPTITAVGATVTITADEGCDIYYTTNNDAPTKESTKYTGPLNLNADCTIKAIAYDEYDNVSGVKSLGFVYLPLEPKNINSNYYVKVTDINELENGDAILIVCENDNVAMSTTQNSNNRGQAEVTINNYAIDCPSASVQKLVLMEKDGGLYFYTGSGFLYAASSSSNYLKTETVPDDNHNAKAEISFDTDGNAQILFKGTNTRNWLKHNNNNSIFSCYASDNESQEIVQIYKEVNRTITVSDAGLATFACDVALDFTSVDGIEAYIAKEESGAIKLHKVNKVPAATGVLLRSVSGAAKAAEVPVATTTDDVTNNIFVRGTGVAVATGEGPYNYVLGKHDGVVGFYKAGGMTVATNKAYLQTTIAAARIDVNFDETTALTLVNSEKRTVNSDIYNLAGQRVANPTKGLYIVNGKKVVIK